MFTERIQCHKKWQENKYGVQSYVLHPLQDGHPCHGALLEVKKIAREKELSEKSTIFQTDFP
jgi:hypothetical protein